MGLLLNAQAIDLKAETPVDSKPAADQADTGGTSEGSRKPGDCDITNVRQFGARGDGISDDRRAIQDAIDAAMRCGAPVRQAGTARYIERDRLGGVVRFPVGRYLIGSPLVLPRSGAYPAHGIALVGANRASTTIAASKGFPAGRALIEWEALPERVQGQSIENLGLDPSSAAGVGAIWFRPTSLESWTAANRESMHQMLFRRLIVYADNSRTPWGIYLGGMVETSVFEDILLDATLGAAPRYSTILLKFDSMLFEGGESARGADYPGLNFSRVRGIAQGLRGGRGTMLSGRVGSSSIADVSHGVGSLNRAPGIELLNCGQVVAENLWFEGTDEDGEILLNGCTSVFLRGIYLGVTEGGGVGLKVLRCRGVVVEGRFSGVGKASFAQHRGRLLQIDRESTDSRFSLIMGNGSFENEVDWRSPPEGRNFIEYLDVESGRREVRGAAPPSP